MIGGKIDGYHHHNGGAHVDQPLANLPIAPVCRRRPKARSYGAHAFSVTYSQTHPWETAQSPFRAALGGEADVSPIDRGVPRNPLILLGSCSPCYECGP